MAGTGTGMAPAAAATSNASAGTGTTDNRYPFLWGTQEQWTPIATIPFVAGTKAAQVRIPKNGYLLQMRYRFVGAANVTTAGSAGTPYLPAILGSVVVSYNGGFQYRQVDGETLHMMNNIRYYGQTDPVTGGPSYTNYSPASATNQNISFVLDDEIGLNTGVNADKYLLAAQARNADITLDVTFGANPNGTFVPNNGIAANTEVAAISGTLYVEGLYLLDPDYTKFKGPDLSKVQQIVTDNSFTSLAIGDNTVPVVPVNGPKYLDLLYKVQCNGVYDPLTVFGGYQTRVQLKINNGLARYDISPTALLQSNVRFIGRPLGRGWLYFNFLEDLSVIGVVSAVGRNVISTEKIANFWLIPTIATGTNITANNLVKLIKRVEMPAVG
jgi:hypothetical protein